MSKKDDLIFIMTHREVDDDVCPYINCPHPSDYSQKGMCEKCWNKAIKEMVEEERADERRKFVEWLVDCLAYNKALMNTLIKIYEKETKKMSIYSDILFAKSEEERNKLLEELKQQTTHDSFCDEFVDEEENEREDDLK